LLSPNSYLQSDEIINNAFYHIGFYSIYNTHIH
jgi:hypothetical protein